MTAALDGVDQIDWHHLETAFGPADDVPRLLSLCADDDVDTARAAALELGDAICHQGSLYPATAVVLPFIITLLEDPRVHSRELLAACVAVIEAAMHDTPAGHVGGAVSVAVAVAASLASPLGVRDVVRSARREVDAARDVRRVWPTLEARWRVLANEQHLVKDAR